MKHITTFLLTCLLITACTDNTGPGDYAKNIIGSWESELVFDVSDLEVKNILTIEYKDDGTEAGSGKFSITGKGISATADYQETSTWKIVGEDYFVTATSMTLTNRSGSEESIKVINRFAEIMQSLVGQETKYKIKKLNNKQMIYLAEDGNESIYKRVN